MNDQPLVSVVIATYNMGQYLPDAVNSVLNQTWKNLEVIVVDDGSTDDTSQRIQPCLADNRVRYIPTENQGQPKAKNTGIHAARGEFIAFCDADDLWRPNKLELQIPAFEDSPVGVVYSEVSYMDGQGQELEKDGTPPRFSGKVTDQMVIRNFVPFGTAVIRRQCLEQEGVFDETLPMGIDWDLWLRYSVNWQFHYLPEETYIYRVWSGQMSKNYRGRYENAIRILDKFLKDHPGLLADALIARAWADMYVSKAMHIATNERTFWEPVKNLLLALRYDVRYWPTWKAVIKLGIRRL